MTMNTADVSLEHDLDRTMKFMVVMVAAGIFLYLALTPGWQAALRSGGMFVMVAAVVGLLYRHESLILAPLIVPSMLWISLCPALEFWAQPTEWMRYLGDDSVAWWGQWPFQLSVLVIVAAGSFAAFRWLSQR
jgi:hypothetical protein